MDRIRSRNLTNGMRNLVFFKSDISESKVYTFAIIITSYRGKLVFVRHKDRQTWEIPAGHIEEGESAEDAAHRELFEETGAIEYELKPLCSYSGKYKGKDIFGKIFVSKVSRFGELPNSEIAEKKFFTAIPKNLTYPEIQTQMLNYYLNL
jgi:8-oxo-dGTP diphosphatase